MQLQESIRNVIQQLSRSVEQLSFEQYAQNCKSLSNATIGQHVRHIIELYQCLHLGYETDKVNYDERKRDINIELNKTLALSLLSEILNNPIKPNKKIILEACYDEMTNDKLLVESNYYREVIYNLEHIVHHMALIRVGIQEISTIQLEKGYGVASSTIKYKQQCAL